MTQPTTCLYDLHFGNVWIQWASSCCSISSTIRSHLHSNGHGTKWWVFHGHGGTPIAGSKWMVNKGKSHLEMDDLGLLPFPETSIFHYTWLFWKPQTESELYWGKHLLVIVKTLHLVTATPKEHECRAMPRDTVTKCREVQRVQRVQRALLLAIIWSCNRFATQNSLHHVLNISPHLSKGRSHGAEDLQKRSK